MGSDRVAKGRRKSNRARTRQRSGERPPESGPIQPGKKTVGQNTGEVAGKRVNTGPQEPQGEWVAVEHRDADGNPTLPKELIAGTYRRRFDEVPDGTEIRVHVLAGYKPKALMLVERKIYEIHRMPVRGWRRIGQIAVEMEGWREHEGAWFTVMRGVKLENSDPGLPGPHNEKSEYIVSETSFHRKIVKSVAQGGKHSELKLYEGTLDISETWKSAWQRQAAEGEALEELALMAKPPFFDRDLDYLPLPFALQRCPDPELKTFCLDPLAALELAPCVTIETAKSLCLQPPGQAMTQQRGRAQLRRRTVAVAPDFSKPFETKGHERLDLVRKRRHAGQLAG